MENDDFLATIETTGTINPDGGSISGEIEVARDADWFAFDAVEGQLFQFMVGNGDIALSVYDADGNLVLSEPIGFRQGPVSDDIIFEVPSDGQYFLSVRGLNRNATAVDPYTVSAVELFDDYGDTVADAETIATDGSTINGRIDIRGDADVFAIDVTAGEVVTFDLNEVQRFTYELLDSNGNIIEISQGRSSSIFDFDYQADFSGTLYLRVTDFVPPTNPIGGSVGSDTGDYSFSVTKSTGVTIIDGTNESDGLRGTAGDDDIAGFAGDDLLIGGNGDDKLFGGAGDDRIEGDDGDDELFGQNGDDRLDGGFGDDYLNGGSGNDVLNGGVGDGADSLFGGRGDDEMFGLDGNDYLNGGSGNDTMEGNAGDDDMFGGNGHDIMLGGTGNDYMSGGGGNDIMRGGSGADLMLGNAGNDRMFGQNGDDVMNGQNGNDTLSGGNGADLIRGQAGNDVLAGQAGHDLLIGGEGADRFVFREGDGFDRIADFHTGEDKLDLRSFDFDSFDDLNFQSVDGTVYLFISETQSIEFTGLDDIIDITAADVLI